MANPNELANEDWTSMMPYQNPPPKTIVILLAFYNGIEYLKQAIDSVKAQTYRDWLLVVGVNGHPLRTDGRGVADKELQSAINKAVGIGQHFDKRIKVHYYHPGKVKGKSTTLNKMVRWVKDEHPEHKWGGILDVDDWWTFDKLQKQVDMLMHQDCYTAVDVVGTQTNYVLCDEKGGETIERKYVVPNGLIIGLPKVMVVNPIINSSAIFLLSDAHWRSEWEGVEDYDMWLRLAKEGKIFFNINEGCCFHRIRHNSSFNIKNHDDALRLVAEYKK
jgi:teichuronic acid biosynthesis glycosyltransferase TuaG